MEPKIYKTTDKWTECRACGRKICFVENENGKIIPVTEEGINHFIDCPARDKFRKK